MARQELFPNNSAYVAQFFPTQNFGSPPSLYFGRFQQANDIYRSLIRFPVRRHQVCRGITSATLELTISRNEVPAGVVANAGLQYALQPWEQFSVTWNTQPIFASIRTFPIINTTPVAKIISLDVTAQVRGWLAGTLENDGFVITGNESVNSLVGINNVHFPAPRRRRLFDPLGLSFPDFFDDEEECRHQQERELVGILAHAARGRSYCRSSMKRRHKDSLRGFDHFRLFDDVDRPDIFVQDPAGSLNFVDSSTVRRRLGRPKLIIDYI